MTVPIPVYRQNPNNDEWEVASVYGSDDCESLGRSLYDGSVHSGSLDDPAFRLQLVLRDESCHRAGYHSSQQHHLDHSQSAHTTYQWDARFAPGGPGGFFIPPPPVVPPPGTIIPPPGTQSPDRAFPPREIYIPSGTCRMTSDSDVGPFSPSPPLSSLPLSPPPRSPSPPMPRPPPALVIPQAPRSYSHSGTGSRHASPIMPPLYSGHTIPPHPPEAGYQIQAPAAVSPSRRSAHDAVSSHSGPVQLQRGQSSEDPAPDMGRGRVSAPNGGRYSFPSYPGQGSGERVDRSQALVEYDPGVSAGGMRMPRPQIRQRQPSVWQKFVRRFSPSRTSVGQT